MNAGLRVVWLLRGKGEPSLGGSIGGGGNNSIARKSESSFEGEGIDRNNEPRG